jgi:hypothetical protein
MKLARDPQSLLFLCVESASCAFVNRDSFGGFPCVKRAVCEVA